MRKIPIIILILFIVAVTGTVVYKDSLQNLYLSKFSPLTVRGTITDISNDSPLDLVEVVTGGRKTFSIYDGTFELSNVKTLNPVSLAAPDYYEDYPQPLACVIQPAKNSPRVVICNAALYPTAGNIAIRVEVVLSVIRPEKGEEMRGRNTALWALLEPISQTSFSNQEIFVEARSLYNLIQRKLSLQQVAFIVDLEKTVLLPEWVSPVSGRVYQAVAEVPVSRTFADGKTVKVSDHFVKVNGIWKFIPEFSLAEINRYNSVNGWVLKQKD
ncbi:MAG: hypothetical protein AAB486_00670 [Patescibacteria group bacterium]